MSAVARRAMARAWAAPLHMKHSLAERGVFVSRNERKLAALRNKHAGERCIIIGGGPSLKRMELAKLRDEVTFGVNGFFHLHDELGYLPTYYVVEDRLVAEDNFRDINAMSGTTKIFPEDLRYRLAPSEETIFVRFERFYDDPDEPGPDFPRFHPKGSLRFYWGGTVSYLNLQLAYFLGFSEVYLIGMDMTYSVPSGQSSNVITSQSDDTNHVHPAWFGPGKRWHDPRVDRMQQAFERSKQAFEDDGRKVFNATIGGKLEVFPRIDLSSVIGCHILV